MQERRAGSIDSSLCYDPLYLFKATSEIDLDRTPDRRYFGLSASPSLPSVDDLGQIVSADCGALNHRHLGVPRRPPRRWHDPAFGLLTPLLLDALVDSEENYAGVSTAVGRKRRLSRAKCFSVIVTLLVRISVRSRHRITPKLFLTF